MQYPTKRDLNTFVSLIQEGSYEITKYLPAVSQDWYVSVMDCIGYVKSTAKYNPDDLCAETSRILYKIVKKHGLTDSNKRTGVIVAYVFLLLNSYAIANPNILKNAARQIARTKGRVNEELIISRVARKLSVAIVELDS